MKNYSILLSALLLLQETAFAQTDTTKTGRTGENQKDSVSQQQILIIPDTNATASLMLINAMIQIEKARKLTNYGIAFGSVANLSVVLNAGLLSGNVDDWEVVTYFVGISTSLARGGLSFATPKHLKKAYNELLMAREISGDITFIENSLNHIRTARRASIAVPLLGVAAWSLIPAGFVGIGYAETEANWGNYCYITGWACAVASLTCTFISSSHISNAKISLQGDPGTLNLGMNKSGIGISFHF